MIYELKRVGVIIWILIALFSSALVSELVGNPPWYLRVLAWFWFPLLIGAFLLVINILDHLQGRREAEKRLQRQLRKQQRKLEKMRRASGKKTPPIPE